MNTQDPLDVFEQALTKKKYSLSTKKSYCHILGLFFRHYEGKSPSEITTEEILSFLYLQKNPNTQCAYYMPLKYFYGKVINQPEKFDAIRLTKRVKVAPKIIDKQFFLRQLTLIGNLKHETILTITYSAGLRVGQLLSLRLEDIDRENMTLTIRDSNEQPHRTVQLSQKVLDLCTRYILVYTPTKYLFNGQSSPKYSPKSCGNVVQKYIGKEYTMEMIRNSSIAALLENGTSLKIIKNHLGHADIKTTKRHFASNKHIPTKLNLPI
jgi:integrase/recombinase XerD